MLANILFSMPVILYAGYMVVATAAFIFFSMASFSTIMNVPQCIFSLGTASLETEYSHSFWLALATGKEKKDSHISISSLNTNLLLLTVMVCRCAVHHHRGAGGDVQLHDTREDERGLQRRC